MKFFRVLFLVGLGIVPSLHAMRNDLTLENVRVYGTTAYGVLHTQDQDGSTRSSQISVPIAEVGAPPTLVSVPDTDVEAKAGRHPDTGTAYIDIERICTRQELQGVNSHVMHKGGRYYEEPGVLTIYKYHIVAVVVIGVAIIGGIGLYLYKHKNKKIENTL